MNIVIIGLFLLIFAIIYPRIARGLFFLAYKLFISMMCSLPTLFLINLFWFQFLTSTSIFYVSLTISTILYALFFTFLEKKYPLRFTDKDREEHRRLQREAQLELLEAEFNNWKIYNKQPLDTNRDFPSYQRLEKLREEFRGGFYYDD